MKKYGDANKTPHGPSRDTAGAFIRMNISSDRRHNTVWDIGSALWRQGAPIHLSLDGAARCWICRAPRAPAVAVFPDSKQSSTFFDDWNSLFPEAPATLLVETPLTNQGIENKALALQRGETILRWREDGGILVTTGRGLLSPVSRGTGEILLMTGREYRRSSFLDWLVHAGYVRSDLVWAPGQFVLRGCILDIFDPSYAHPVRLEFFDDTLESIRSFSPRTQKSVGVLDELSIHSTSTVRETAIADYFGDDTLFLLFDPVRIESGAMKYEMIWKELASVHGGPPLISWQDLMFRLASGLMLRITDAAAMAREKLAIEEVPLFKGNLDRFRWMCETWKNDGYHIRLFTENPRLASIFEEDVQVIPGSLSKGFADPVMRVINLSDVELSGVTRRRSSAVHFVPPQEWSDQLADGRLLMHEEYGLCVFRGAEEVKISGESVDSLILEFADNKRLFLPALLMHKITPLAEQMDGEVRLDSLKGTRWKKSVQKTRERVEQEVRSLLELYAKRELVEGFAFPGRDDLFDQFEESFPHPETKDQLTAITEILDNMERPYPMDRLLVGDVGYGKTEVALRAAFRAAQAGKQTAFLVPTTILAQQHYLTFTARLTGFPVTVGILSRFLTKKEQNEVIRKLSTGAIDILIGTIRMLKDDVIFKDLGLLIVDEEHRFGVMSKERIKQAKEDIDVLMLSATPIPRTLALSLKGLRNFSVINEAPGDRIPVMTSAAPWSESLVRKAISSEIERGGQVFYVANRISGMEKKLATLRRLFPDVVIAMAHGRMREQDLEETMTHFFSGHVKILLCTTIIESGLDIPNANTIIIEDCHELGLAQMYQLRGRVGRRDEAAFAYFLYPPEKPLTRETLDRLDAITSLDNEGAGYNLAMQDLRIRGGGELIGTTQHGKGARKTDSILYYSLLEEEIGKLQGKAPSNASVSVEIPCFVPSFYIPQESVRIALYRRLLRVSSVAELDDMAKESRDRFGDLPESLENLFSVSFLRSKGGLYGILSVACTRMDTTIAGGGPLFDHLATSKRWIPRNRALTGPGGGTGLKDLLSGIRHLKRVL